MTQMTPPPLPVIRDVMGFRMFAHPDGRFSHAVTVGGQQVYASDYEPGPLTEAGMVEPGELEFVAALVRQGKKQ